MGRSWLDTSPPSPLSLLSQFVQGNAALYIKYSVGLQSQYPYVIAVLLVSTIVWMPLWQFVLLKFGKKKAFFAGMWILMPTQLLTLFVPFLPYSMYALAAVGGMGVSCAYLLPWWVWVAMASMGYHGEHGLPWWAWVAMASMGCYRKIMQLILSPYHQCWKIMMLLLAKLKVHYAAASWLYICHPELDTETISAILWSSPSGPCYQTW